MASRRQRGRGSEKADIVMDSQNSALALRTTHDWRAWMVLIAMMALVDVMLYRSVGFAGPAVFFPVAVALLLWGRGRSEWNKSLIVVTSLLILLSGSMIWAGGYGQIMAAVWLLIAANLSAQGVTPCLLESTIALAAIVPGGYEFLHGFQLNWRRRASHHRRCTAAVTSIVGEREPNHSRRYQSHAQKSADTPAISAWSEFSTLDRDSVWKEPRPAETAVGRSLVATRQHRHQCVVGPAEFSRLCDAMVVIGSAIATDRYTPTLFETKETNV